ncbi:hypothetical protein J5N97_030077 [Dioscorea zingiberensis]|uniref:Uncharacterized protein n=1 Tax=Dioscorea zingiberensis TaxID=325984 RepID=A0A9D5BX48_9LILI|nr:hypothetical protein J5N97_030077 [Dioscorea zingiberensis]
MWVDLTLEAQLMKQDIDDAWFQTSHLIHQMPSHCLKSSSEVQFNSPKMLYQLPKLPDSVSRSRGKDFKSRKWAMDELSSPMEIPSTAALRSGDHSMMTLFISLLVAFLLCKASDLLH